MGKRLPVVQKVHAGQKEGDIMSLPLDALEHCELLVSGPPCQPFSAAGKRQGELDSRADVFLRVVAWIQELASRGTLLAFALENSPQLKGHEFLKQVVQELQVTIPYFKLQVLTRNASDMLPQNRERLWLRGILRDCLAEPTSPLPAPWGLREFSSDGRAQQRLSILGVLSPGLPNIQISTLTPNAQANLAVYKQLARKMVGADTELVLLELDRNPLKEYGPKIFLDKCPTLRCRGEVFILSTDGLHQDHVQGYRFHRYLVPSERLALMGHNPTITSCFKTAGHVTAAAGNCFHTLELASMVAPMMESAAEQGILRPRQPMRKLSQTELTGLIPSPVEFGKQKLT